MTADQIRKFHTASPFRPFRVHMANGRFVKVPHPDFMNFSPNDRLISVWTDEDAFEVIDVFLVTSVEAMRQNGARKSRRGKKS